MIDIDITDIDDVNKHKDMFEKALYVLASDVNTRYDAIRTYFKCSILRAFLWEHNFCEAKHFGVGEDASLGRWNKFYADDYVNMRDFTIHYGMLDEDDGRITHLYVTYRYNNKPHTTWCLIMDLDVLADIYMERENLKEPVALSQYEFLPKYFGLGEFRCWTSSGIGCFTCIEN